MLHVKLSKHLHLLVIGMHVGEHVVVERLEEMHEEERRQDHGGFRCFILLPAMVFCASPYIDSPCRIDKM